MTACYPASGAQKALRLLAFDDTELMFPDDIAYRVIKEGRMNERTAG